MVSITVCLPEEGGVVLSRAAAEGLVRTGSGDAALLYIALLQNRSAAEGEMFGWPEERLSGALRILADLKLIELPEGMVKASSIDKMSSIDKASSAGKAFSTDKASSTDKMSSASKASPMGKVSFIGEALSVGKVSFMGETLSMSKVSSMSKASSMDKIPSTDKASSVGNMPCMGETPSGVEKLLLLPPDSQERPEYTRADMACALEGAEFATLVAAVEEKLGKKLTTPDVAILLGLYDYLGLPPDVIYLLVGFCMERLAQQYGPGRRPTLRQIEKEGYLWARLGLMSQETAAAHIRKYHHQREVLPRLMTLLRLGDRPAAPSEEKFLLSWNEMGFEDAAIELAYDKTILKCKELKWAYMNKILLSWHQKGLHTVQAIQERDCPRRAGARKTPSPLQETAETVREDMARMDKYLQELRRQREEKDGI